MKKCPKCKNLYSDDLEKCPTCDEYLDADESKGKFNFAGIFEEYNKAIISCALIASFLLGFGFKSCTGINRDDYNSLLSQNQTLTKENEKLSDEYSAYKAKMQPYEQQQAADVKAAAEKKAAEEKAKREAEEQAAAEKAAQEAEAKAAAEKALKEETLGISTDEFIQKFNIYSAQLNSSVTAIKPSSTNDNYVDIRTSSNSVVLSTYSKQGYVEMVYISGRGDGSTTSAVEQLYSMVAAAQAIDNSLEVSEISNFLTGLISGAPQNGDNHSQTKNGLTYTVSAMPGSTLLQISK